MYNLTLRITIYLSALTVSSAVTILYHSSGNQLNESKKPEYEEGNTIYISTVSTTHSNLSLSHEPLSTTLKKQKRNDHTHTHNIHTQQLSTRSFHSLPRAPTIPHTCMHLT